MEDLSDGRGRETAFQVFASSFLVVRFRFPGCTGCTIVTESGTSEVYIVKWHVTIKILLPMVFGK